MNVRDTTAHIIKQQVRAEVRRQVKSLSTTGGKAVSGTPNTGAGTLVSGGTAQPGSSSAGTNPASSSGSPSGTDYSVWPLAATDFTSFETRLGNLEQFATQAFVKSMRPDSDGHHHSGADGDGPNLPATAILLPGGHVGGGTTLADHLTDASLHAASRALFWDDFEGADQAQRWRILAGTPVREVNLDNGTHRWRLPAGTVLRFKNDTGHSYTRRLTLRFDFAFVGSGGDRRFEVRTRVRPGASGFTYIAGISTSEACYLAELDNSTATLTPETTGTQVANDGVMRPYTVILTEDALRLVYLDQDVSYAIPRSDAQTEGYIEFYATAECWIDDLLLVRHYGAVVEAHGAEHHAVGSDPLDVADLADRDGLLAPGGTPGLHAPTHSAMGSDPVEVGDLADTAGQMLTGPQRVALTTGANADGYHTHDGLLALATAAPPAANLAGGVGTGADAARADHTHALPNYTLDYYLASSYSAGSIPADADFDIAPLSTVRNMRHPTAGGEFLWRGYGQFLYCRARLQVKNVSGVDKNVTFTMPSLKGAAKVLMFNSLGSAVLVSDAVGGSRQNTTFVATFKAGETSTLTIYGGGSAGDEWAFWFAPDDDLFAVANDLVFVP